MKRLLSLALVMCLLFSLIPLKAQAASNQNQELESVSIETVQSSISSDAMLAAGDNAYIEVEPNDDFDTANLLHYDNTVVATLSGDDIDCYAFEISEEGTGTIACAATTDRLIIEV